MNREITTGGASIYPLQGDVKSSAGNNTVTVVGLNTIPLGPGFPSGGEVLTYDGPTNTLLLEAPVQQIELETNGSANSTQTLLNLAAGSNVTLTESAGTVTIASTGAGGAVTRSATTTNSNGSFWTWSDGFIEAWGEISIPSSGTEINGGTITFSTVFPTAVQSLQLTLVTLPNTGSFDIASVQAQSMTGSGAVINLQCSVPTGGGGTTFNQAVTVMWRAIGT